VRCALISIPGQIITYPLNLVPKGGADRVLSSYTHPSTTQSLLLLSHACVSTNVFGMQRRGPISAIPSCSAATPALVGPERKTSTAWSLNHFKGSPLSVCKSGEFDMCLHAGADLRPRSCLHSPQLLILLLSCDGKLAPIESNLHR
jgi:hypothetical protein